jgi:hypothetical protein
MLSRMERVPLVRVRRPHVEKQTSTLIINGKMNQKKKKGMTECREPGQFLYHPNLQSFNPLKFLMCVLPQLLGHAIPPILN